MSSLILLYSILSTFQAQDVSFTMVDDDYPLSLPRADRGMAVGYDAATQDLLLLGGVGLDNDEQCVAFNAFTFNDEDQNFLSASGGIYGFGQYYTQIDNILYMIDNDGNNFVTVNLETRDIDLSLDIPHTVEDEGCVASMDSTSGSFLYVVGGYKNGIPLDLLQIYDLNVSEWVDNAVIPQLNEARAESACIVRDTDLYAIGGTEDGLFSLKSIEKIDAINYPNWQTLTDDTSITEAGITYNFTTDRVIPEGLSSARAILYDGDILIIGGWSSGNIAYPADITIIKPDDSVVIDGSYGSLVHGISAPAVICVNDMLYIFGGIVYDVDAGWMRYASYQYLELGTTTTTTTTTAAATTDGALTTDNDAADDIADDIGGGQGNADDIADDDGNDGVQEVGNINEVVRSSSHKLKVFMALYIVGISWLYN